MKCPYCASMENKVVDKRETPDSKSTRRRRECISCTKRFTTYERVEAVDIVVIKKDGKREMFDRNKLKSGIMRSCEKRPVTQEQVDSIIDSIDNEVRKRDSTEIKSSVIGNIVIRKLRKLDKVAYIRFASVYRDFTDIESFHEELKKLLKK